MTDDPFAPDAISPETAAFLDDLKETLATMPAPHELPPAVARQARAEGKSIFPPSGPFEGSDWIEAPTTPGRARLTPGSGALIIHVHGSGWTLGAPEQNDGWCQHLARETGAAVISLPYRLAPEHPWPACADDVEAGAVWAIETLAPTLNADRFAICGESAGAHLALVALLRLRARDLLTDMRAALLHYGCFDLRMTPSALNWGEEVLILSTPAMQWFADNLTTGDQALKSDPEVSPMFADLSGLPPALFQCGTADPLLDDTLFMTERWKAAGNEAERKLYPGGVHAFERFDLAISRQARTAAAEFLKTRLA